MSHGHTSGSRRAIPASGAELPEKVPLEEEEEDEEEGDEGADSFCLKKEQRDRPGGIGNNNSTPCPKCGPTSEETCTCNRKGASETAAAAVRKETIEDVTHLRRKLLGKQLTDILMMDSFRISELEPSDSDEVRYNTVHPCRSTVRSSSPHQISMLKMFQSW
jgi:hypothetical protein